MRCLRPLSSCHSQYWRILQIRWEDRFIGAVPGQFCFTNVDGLDCRAHESRTPFWTGWWSHKFNGPGLRYEVATCKATGEIVHTNGPFPPANFPDHVIFMMYLGRYLLCEGELVDCDRLYTGKEDAEHQTTLIPLRQILRTLKTAKQDTKR